MSAILKTLRADSAYLAWATALAASAISLGLSDVLHYTPCTLCWYQRICMYPLVIIIGVGVVRRSRDWPYMALPLAVIGWLLALYHSLLQWGVIPESIAPCQIGVSCATKQVDLLGFITIPFASWMAFTVILGLIWLNMMGGADESRN